MSCGYLLFLWRYKKIIKIISWYEGKILHGFNKYTKGIVQKKKWQVGSEGAGFFYFTSSRFSLFYFELTYSGLPFKKNTSIHVQAKFRFQSGQTITPS